MRGEGAEGPIEVVTIGAATVDRHYRLTNLPERDGGAFAHAVTESFGGVGANVATGLCRLGRPAGLVARLGDDDLGARILDDLESGPIDVARIRREAGVSTHCLVCRDDAGDRMIITAGDSAKRLRLREADLAYVRAADVVFLTAYVPDAVAAAVLEAATASPDFPAVAFDLSGPLEELAGRGTARETIDRLLSVCDLFVANEVAAESYLGADAAEAPTALAERGVERGAVTYGVDGATLFSGDERARIDAYDVETADTTGAGDAFVAALLDRWLLSDEPMASAGRYAAAAAAINCTSEYARDGMPGRDDIEAFLRTREARGGS